jgi:hypothetical protein
MTSASPRNTRRTVRNARRTGALALACLGGFLGVISVLPVRAGSPQSSPAPSQAQIRAALVFNFPKFAEWPTISYVDSGSPLSVCFLGADDVRAAFEAISAGKAVSGRFVEVRAVKSAGDAHGCQVVYMDSPNSPVVLDVLKYARQGNELAIGTTDDFLANGGMIRLQVENNRMRFDVNVGAVGRTKIKLSSKLLALARSVVDLPDPAGN